MLRRRVLKGLPFGRPAGKTRSGCVLLPLPIQNRRKHRVYGGFLCFLILYVLKYFSVLNAIRFQIFRIFSNTPSATASKKHQFLFVFKLIFGQFSFEFCLKQFFVFFVYAYQNLNHLIYAVKVVLDFICSFHFHISNPSVVYRFFCFIIKIALLFNISLLFIFNQM